jgi:putative flippase GtrA
VIKHVLSRRFLSFAIIGTAALPVDAAVLYTAMFLGSGPYLGRVVSYLVAATTTWALNRRFTFRELRSPDRLKEWSRFLAANAAGGLVNYGVYALLVATSAVVARWPIIGIAAGSLAGLSLNFTLSRGVVFTGPRVKV